MDKRWMRSDDGGMTFATEVFPVGTSSFTDTQDLGKGQIFFRRAIDSSIKLTGSDFDHYWTIERNSSLRCEDQFIRQEWMCSGMWKVYWTGIFSTGSGSFDLDKCIFEVKPEVYDRYTCIVDQVAAKSNLLLQPYETVTSSYMPFIRFGMSVYDGYSDPPGYITYNVSLDGSGNPFNGWALQGYEYIDPSGPGDGYNYRMWWREEYTTDCIGGLPQTPPGTGWVLLYDGCSDTTGPYIGKAVYARPPQFSYTVDGSNLFPGDCGTPPDPSLCPGGIFIEAYTCDWVIETVPGMLRPSIWVCFRGIQTTYTRARTLSSAFDQLLLTMDCGLAGIRSDFLGINPQGDAPGYVAGENYVTHEPTQTEGIVLIQNTDALDPSASNPATIGESSFAEIMQMLSSMRLFWDIDDDGYVRIEHWIYWTFPLGLDIFADDQALQPLAYKHLSEEIPRFERMKWAAAGGKDFVGVDIIYSGPCVKGDDAKEYNMGKFETDISFIQANDNPVPNDGFLVLATMTADSVTSVILDTGVLSGSIITNAPLSTANLEDAFWRWDRYLPTGNMNGADTTFDGYLPNIEQNPVIVDDLCCGILDLDPNKRVKTELGETLGGILGHINKMTLDSKSSKLTLTLRYPY